MSKRTQANADPFQRISEDGIAPIELRESPNSDARPAPAMDAAIERATEACMRTYEIVSAAGSRSEHNGGWGTRCSTHKTATVDYDTDPSDEGR
jgi:hypothetical protein